MKSKTFFISGIIFVCIFCLATAYGQIPDVPDIEVKVKVWIRGDLTDAEMHRDVAEIDIAVPGHYRIFADAFYNSGDDQLNETFYLLVRNADGTIEYPVDANAGPYKVVVDDPGPKHGAWRDGGLFYFSAGKHVVELHHYYVIADIYPQFINIVMGGSESVRLDGLRIEYEPFQDGAVHINGNTPRFMPLNGYNVGVVYPGESFPYHIKIDNKERDILYAPRLICQIPNYIETSQFSVPPDERQGNKMIWSLPDLTNGGSTTIDFAAHVPATWDEGTTPVFSRAWLVVEQDRVPKDNSHSDLDYIYVEPMETDTLLADLSLKIHSFPDSMVVSGGDTTGYAHRGDTVPYEVSFVNLGPDTAFNVQVINHLPRKIEVENFSLEPNESLTGVLIWNFAFVAPRSRVDITYDAQIDTSLRTDDYLLINNALVSSLNDTILHNNFDSDTVIVNPLPPPPVDVPDLAILHEVITDTMVYIDNVLENAVSVGKSYQCRISVENMSQVSAKNVKIWNSLPDSIRVDHFNIPFHYDHKNRIYWRYDLLESGGSVDIYYMATVFDTLPFTPFPLTSEVGVYAEKEVDNTDNFARQTIYAVADSDLVEPDLTNITVSQTAETDTFRIVNGDTQKVAAAGEVYNIKLTVTNKGNTSAKNIMMTDVLPDSVTAVRFSPLPAHVGSDSLKWFVSELAVRDDTTMSIDVRVSPRMPLGQNLLINHVHVTAENEDPAFLFDNVALDTVYNDGAPKSDTLAADVALLLSSKTDSLGADLQKYTRPGGEIDYQIKIVNTGPDTAFQVRVENYLPHRVDVSGIMPAPVFADSAKIQWDLLFIAPDNPVDLTFKARVDSPLVEKKTLLADSVYIFAKNDTTPANNSAVDTVWALKQDGPVVTENADLEIVKTVLPVRTDVGQDVVFQVLLKNNGPDQADRIQVRDYWPAGLDPGPHTVSSGVFDAENKVWSLDSLKAGGVATLNMTATTQSVGWWANGVFVTALDQNDPDIMNNFDYATVVAEDKAVVLPDLRLQKSADKAQMNTGENVLFTIQVTNDGPVAAGRIRVFDAVHPSFEYRSAQTANGHYAPETATWAIDTLQAGETATLEVAAVARHEGLAVNYAKIIQVSPGDNDYTNNDDVVFVNIGPGGLPKADLAVSKSVKSLPDIPRIGDHVEYEITITNLSSTSAQNVRVRERLPDGLGYIGHSPAEYDYSAAGGMWRVGTLEAGGSRTLVLRAEILRSGKIRNCVHIDFSSQQDPDVDNDEACAEIDVPVLGADVGVEVSALPSWVRPDQPVEFKVIVTNYGPKTADVEIRDRFPAGFDLSGRAATAGEYQAATQTWDIGALAAGDSAMLTLTAQSRQPGLWTYYARVSSSSQPDPDSSNNSDGANVAVRQPDASLPDVQLTKNVDKSRVSLGEPVVFTIVVANNGPNTARQIEIHDRLNSGLALTTHTAETGVFDAKWHVWHIDSLAAGQSATLRLTAETKVEGLQVNYSYISAVQPGDSDWNNNDDVVFVNVTPGGLPEVDLAVTKTVVSVPAQPQIGDEIQFAMTVENKSDSHPAHHIRVLERIPAGLKYLGHSPAHLDYNQNSNVWQVGTLNAGQSLTLVLRAEILRTGKIKNCIHIENSSQQDPDVSNDESCAEIYVPVPGADLGVEVSASPGRLTLDETAVFHVLVTNHGPENAVVQVQNRYPDGLTMTGHIVTAGEYQPGTGRWDIGTLAAGDSVSLELTGTARQEGLWGHYARILTTSQTDPDSSNDSDAAQVVVWKEDADLPDVHLVKSVNKPGAALGEPVIFTLVAANTGPNTARHIHIYDRLHPGLVLQDYTAEEGRFDPDWRIWEIDSLAAGESVNLQITALTTAEGLLVNYAKITAVQPGDADWNNNDDVAFVNVPPGGVPGVDLAVTKTAVSVPSQPKIGDEIRFAITVENKSAGTAAHFVRVLERMPVGLKYISHSPEEENFNSRTHVWNVGSVLAGESVTLTITAEITKTGRIVNCTHIENSSRPDPDTGNDESCAELNVDEPRVDLGIIQTAQTDSMAVVDGDTLKYAGSGETYIITLRVTNPGPLVAENVVVRDVLPGQVTATNIDPQPAVAGADTLEWHFPVMAAGSEMVLRFDAGVYPYMPEGTNLIVNTASVEAGNEDAALQDNNVTVDTVYNYVGPIEPVQPVIESNPPVVPVENPIHVRVRVPEPVKLWDVWIYLPNGQIDSTFADDYIDTHELNPETWYDLEPGYTEDHLISPEKYDELIFEIRTTDYYGGFAVGRDTSYVKSKDHLVLDRNVFEPDKDGLLAINFRLSSRRIARLDIYDVNGRLVTRVAEKVFEGGLNTHMWDGRTMDGQRVGSGVYLVTLRAGEYNSWKKFILVR